MNAILKCPIKKQNGRHNYKFAWVNKTVVYAHRVVMEQILGRPLKPCEIVHHKNGNGHDNRPENLEVITRSTHQLSHLFPKYDIEKAIKLRKLGYPYFKIAKIVGADPSNLRRSLLKRMAQ